MKVTGFTFVRNAVKYDYPVVEAIRSVLPLCDDFVVAVGNSEDGTLEMIRQIDPEKIKIINTVWDDSLREGGKVLAAETDKAFQAIDADSDWCFYIQGDEVVHERDLDTIRRAMLQWKEDPSVDGLLFNYLHFYGSYDYIRDSNRWYKKEIRVIRNNKHIYSYRDAQGFRKEDNQKLHVKAVDAYIYHYGCVKNPRQMKLKVENSARLYHDNDWIEKNISKGEEFDFGETDSFKRFTDTHPQVMWKRIAEKNWDFNYKESQNRSSWKDRFKDFLKDYLHMDLYYRNYIVIPPGRKR
ncbi:MAG: glycosyltransferase family 2 protein [Chitinophagaceae bacterium]|jgi:hypothetical protein|nr:MAG: glycosyltransferase family 2 protein [Chitinophagaceae bacterium]